MLVYILISVLYNTISYLKMTNNEIKTYTNKVFSIFLLTNNVFLIYTLYIYIAFWTFVQAKAGSHISCCDKEIYIQ